MHCTYVSSIWTGELLEQIDQETFLIVTFATTICLQETVHRHEQLTKVNKKTTLNFEYACYVIVKCRPRGVYGDLDHEARGREVPECCVV